MRAFASISMAVALVGEMATPCRAVEPPRFAVTNTATGATGYFITDTGLFLSLSGTLP
jgi:hypothetical protein